MEWRVLTALQTIKIGKKLWIVRTPMIYETPEGQFVVPAGYLTDHASVPRVFTNIVPPVQSEVAEASVLHDWLYNKDSEDVPREFADLCLRELTIAKGGSTSLAYTAYTAVRLGGGSLYNKEYFKEKIKREAYQEYTTCSPEMLNMIFHIGE
jgi:hypothetical protein